jgi:hypothetical protein
MLSHHYLVSSLKAAKYRERQGEDVLRRQSSGSLHLGRDSVDQQHRNLREEVVGAKYVDEVDIDATQNVSDYRAAT